MKWFSLALSRYAAFSGRSQRAEFWFYVLLSAVIELALLAVDTSLGWVSANGDFGLLSSVATLFFLIPAVSVATRRLHDIGKSGWWQLLVLIPLLGILMLIYWWTQDGQAGTNLYGPNPKETLNP